MIHINYDRNKDAEEQSGKREIFIAKNKQNGRLAKIQVFFDRERLEFREDSTNVNVVKYNDNNDDKVFSDDDLKAFPNLDPNRTYTEDELF